LVEWIYLAQDEVQLRAFVKDVIDLQVLQTGATFLDQQSGYSPVEDSCSTTFSKHI
jgi:hypothetical protein